jgi:hypothetical protein
MLQGLKKNSRLELQQVFYFLQDPISYLANALSGEFLGDTHWGAVQFASQIRAKSGSFGAIGQCAVLELGNEPVRVCLLLLRPLPTLWSRLLHHNIRVSESINLA